MRTDQPLTGVLPVLQTPYRDDESIDADTLRREIEWLFERGADGITVAMVSEVLRLATDEREQLASLVCKFAETRGPVIISVGAESNHVAERLTRHAEQCGASAVMAIPPLAVAIAEDELLHYYHRIIASSDLPVIVQDASGYVGRSLSVAFQAQLVHEHGPNRVLFKPEATPLGPRLSQLRDATGGKARVFEGSGGLALLDSYSRGIVGTMPGADLIDGVVALWRALLSRDEERAHDISAPLSSLVALQSGLDGFLAVEKYLLVKQKIFVNAIVRGPVGFTLDDETRRAVDRLFERLQRTVATKGQAA